MDFCLIGGMVVPWYSQLQHIGQCYVYQPMGKRTCQTCWGQSVLTSPVVNIQAMFGGLRSHPTFIQPSTCRILVSLTDIAVTHDNVTYVTTKMDQHWSDCISQNSYSSKTDQNIIYIMKVHTIFIDFIGICFPIDVCKIIGIISNTTHIHSEWISWWQRNLTSPDLCF